MSAGAIAAGRRRAAPVLTPPISDDFTGALDYSKWAGSTYGVSNVAGRIQIPVSADYPQAQTATVFDLSLYPLWVEAVTIPPYGNGSKYTRFVISNGSNRASFYFNGTPGAIIFQCTGQANASITYNATDHRWVQFRLAEGNLVWETSPDKLTWTVVRTVPTPAWLAGSLVRVGLDGAFSGTETASFAEYDNFNV